MTPPDTATALDFIRGLFSESTSDPVFVCSLPNDKADPKEPGEKSILSRDPDEIAAFLVRWDRPGRAVYFCVGTLTPSAQPDKPGGSRRLKTNVAEITAIHADIDAKDIEDGIDAVLTAIRERLERQPSAIVRSGNGLHVYFRLKEAILDGDPDMDRAEALMKQLSDLLGGDLKVAHRAALMRLPGSHNSKHGDWKPVGIEMVSWGRCYGLDEIEDMVCAMAPIVRRRQPVTAPGVQALHDNPYLAVAARLGHRPPMDVEQRLAAMSFGGVGETSIHETQLAVSASLLTRGVETDEVVSLIQQATQAAAGPLGANWNWQREEREIRRMCVDWVRKHPEVVESPRPESRPRPSVEGNTARVHQLDEHRAKKPKAKPAPVINDDKTPSHIVLATAMIEVADDEDRPFLAVQEPTGERQLYRYDEGLWRVVNSLDVDIEVAARACRVRTTIKIRNEVSATIRAWPEIVRPRGEVAWDGHGMIPCRNGLLDPLSLTLHAYAPEHFATWRLPHDYVPAAPCPMWDEAISTFFRDKADGVRAQYVALIQEVFGAGLLATRSRALSRALVLFGPHNAGKSQVLHVAEGLYGKNPIAQPLTSLEGEHGTVPFARHAPWVLHEAFNQGKWVLSDKIKSLITSEPITINIKRGAQFDHVFRGPILWGTNHAPSIKDASRAVASRMLVVPCNGGFDDERPTGVALQAAEQGFAKLADFIIEQEGPGVLRWAVDGLRSVLERRRYDPPAEMADLQREIYDDSNPVAEFVRECCNFDPERMVSCTDWIAAYTVWWVQQRGEGATVPSTTMIGRSLAALGEKRIGLDKQAFRDKASRYYGGLSLNDEGLDFWSSAETSNAARGRSTGIAASRQVVNAKLPSSWSDREPVQRMIEAHRVVAAKTERVRDAVEGVSAAHLSESPDTGRKPDTGPDLTRTRF